MVRALPGRDAERVDTRGTAGGWEGFIPIFSDPQVTGVDVTRHPRAVGRNPADGLMTAHTPESSLPRTPPPYPSRIGISTPCSSKTFLSRTASTPFLRAAAAPSSVTSAGRFTTRVISPDSRSLTA
ncbi:hypothetical protein DSECCO2_642490 [anaerobic digester metagenome]